MRHRLLRAQVSGEGDPPSREYTPCSDQNPLFHWLGSLKLMPATFQAHNRGVLFLSYVLYPLLLLSLRSTGSRRPKRLHSRSFRCSGSGSCTNRDARHRMFGHSGFCGSVTRALVFIALDSTPPAPNLRLQRPQERNEPELQRSIPKS